VIIIRVVAFGMAKLPHVRKRRPVTVPKPRRTHAVFVRFGEAEHAELLRLAGRCPLATYVRERALAS
jgi:hypothetical protein